VETVGKNDTAGLAVYSRLISAKVKEEPNCGLFVPK